MRSPAPPFIRDRQFAFDFALCAVVALFTVTAVLINQSDLESVALGLMITLPLMVRRLLPTVAFGVMLAGALGTLLVLAVPAFLVTAAIPPTVMCDGVASS